MSKLCVIYIKALICNMLFVFPLLEIYLIKIDVLPKIHFLMALYPLLISFFEIGLGYLLSILIYGISKFLDKHHIVKFSFGLIISIGFCVAYYFALNAFLFLARDNNISKIFSEESLITFSNISMFMFPTKFFIDVINNQFNYLYLIILISALTFFAGTLIGTKVYKYNLQNHRETKEKNKQKKCKLTSVNKALLNKEFKLLFKNSSNGLSYSMLLLMQPVLTLFVVFSMNTIFNTGLLTYVVSYFPYTLSIINILFVVLFSVFVNAASSLSLSRERSCLRVLKTIPVSYKKQINFKLIVPYISSAIITLIGVSVLMGTRLMSVPEGMFAFALSLLMCLIFEVLGTILDLKNPSENEESNSSILITILSILFPIILGGIAFVLCLYKLNIYISLTICLAIVLLVAVPMIIYLEKRVSKLFVALEMEN